MSDDNDSGRGVTLGTNELIALGAAATILIATMSSLAVNGALQQAQRNHGVLLIIAFAGVLVAAALWALAVVPKWEQHGVRSTLMIVAVVCFIGGLGLGIWGMIITQQAQERPAVTASLDDKNVLSATATAHNLGTEGRMYTEVTGLKPTSVPDDYDVVRLYFAISGPDAGGTATQQFTYLIPRNTYRALAVSATTGSDTGCFDKQPKGRLTTTDPKLVANAKEVAQRDQPGCVLIFQP